MRTLAITVVLCALAFTAGAQERHRGGWEHGQGGNWGGHSQHWHGPGYGHDNPFGNVLGGIIGGYLWRQFNQPEVQAGPSVDWCIQRYHSYDPATHTYLGFDGLRHGCP